MDYWHAFGRTQPGEPFWSRYYHRLVHDGYQYLIPSGQRVFVLSCWRGDLLTAVRPSFGICVGFFGAMLAQARRRHPYLTFVKADVYRIPLTLLVDVVILSDLAYEPWYVMAVLRQVLALLIPRAGHPQLL
jgi:hypothetical protein